MRNFGLIGRPLSHSFSKSYFEDKWKKEGIDDCQYQLYALDTISEIEQLLDPKSLVLGLNVTIPYKKEVMVYLDELDPIAKEIGSVNCLKRVNNRWIGYNTDAIAFQNSLRGYLEAGFDGKALILGSGGASKAVQWALNQMGIPYNIVSNSGNGISYLDLNSSWDSAWKLLINATPLGMWPFIETKPSIPYEYINDKSYLYDLVYNPEKSLFLTFGAQQGSRIKNGMEMLHLQANYSWKYWNE